MVLICLRDYILKSFHKQILPTVIVGDIFLSWNRYVCVISLTFCSDKSSPRFDILLRFMHEVINYKENNFVSFSITALKTLMKLSKYQHAMKGASCKYTL